MRPTREQVLVLTGATGRLGRALTHVLPRHGRTLVLVGRDAGDLAATRLDCSTRDPHAHVETVRGDLSTTAGVRLIAEEIENRWQHVDALIHAAVAMPHYRQESDDGVELQLAVNHLAPFALTSLLLEALRRDGEGRVFAISDTAWQRGSVDLDDLDARRGYGIFGWKQYANTRRMGVLFVDELARRAAGTNVVAVAVGPDRSLTPVDATGFYRAAPPLRPVLRAPADAAARIDAWIDASDLSGWSGAWLDRDGHQPLPLTDDERAVARALWRESARRTGLASD